MELEKLKVDWKRVLITSAIVLLSALVVGGTTWYVMDKSAKEVAVATEAQAEELQTLVNKLEEESAVKEPATAIIDDDTSVASPTAVATGLSTLEDYCKTANNGVLLVGYSYMKTLNGEFANCGLGDGVSPGGAMLIAKYKNNAWVKLWSGNGVIEDSVCDADKIPNKMSGGTCNY